MTGSHLMRIHFIQMRDSITVHIPTLIGIGLNANQYMHLALLHHQLPVNLAPLTEVEMEELIEKGYLIPSFTGSELGDQGKELFESTESFMDKAFKELYETFPRQVPDGRGGYRVLRAKNLDSEDAKVCRRKYEGVIKSDKNLHDKVMKGLRTELVMRKSSMTYMQNLQTWLNQRAWEKYMDLDVDLGEDERVSSI